MAKISKATCGKKATGRNLRNYIRECVEDLGFESFLTELEPQMTPEIKANEKDHYERALMHIENALFVP